MRAFREELLRRVSSLPGFESAGTVSALPMGMIQQQTDFEIAGRSETNEEPPNASYANVSAEYLRAMGIPLVAGRYFERSDSAASQPVTVVSEQLARTWWQGEAALGARIHFDSTWFTVIGIVKDVRQNSPERAAVGEIYALNHQLPMASQGAASGGSTYWPSARQRIRMVWHQLCAAR